MDDKGSQGDTDCYGSGFRTTSNDHRLRLSDLPQFGCSKAEYAKWEWGAQQHISGYSLHEYYWGLNRKQKSCGDAKVEAEYERGNQWLFTVMLYMLGGTKPTDAQSCMTNRIQNEFGNDRDGFGLVTYLDLWAKELTNAEVKMLKKVLAETSFKSNQSPDKMGAQYADRVAPRPSARHIPKRLHSVDFMGPQSDAARGGSSAHAV